MIPAAIPWRALAAAVLAAALFAAGWTVSGWRSSAEIDALRARHAALGQQAGERARRQEAALAEAIARIDQVRTAERRKADEEITRLRAALDAGAVRLRVAVRCPTPLLPEAAAGAGVDHGAGAELAADARPDYFALRSGIGRLEAKLAACQSVLQATR